MSRGVRRQLTVGGDEDGLERVGHGVGGQHGAPQEIGKQSLLNARVGSAASGAKLCGVLGDLVSVAEKEIKQLPHELQHQTTARRVAGDRPRSGTGPGVWPTTAWSLLDRVTVACSSETCCSLRRPSSPAAETSWCPSAAATTKWITLASSGRIGLLRKLSRFSCMHAQAAEQESKRTGWHARKPGR